MRAKARWGSYTGVPARLVEELEACAVAPDAGADAFALAGVRAAQDVADRPDREAAQRLLAADALVTWACEQASAEPDPGRAIERVLQRVLEEL